MKYLGSLTVLLIRLNEYPLTISNMSVQKRIETYTFNGSSLNKFDEILNVEMRRRYSDTGFAQQWQWQCSPRKPFYNTPAIPASYTWSTSDIFIYEVNNIFYAYRVINKTTNWTRSYVLQYKELSQTVAWPSLPDGFTIWTDVKVLYTSITADECKVKFDLVNVPMLNGAWVPSPYFTPTVATATDRVKRSASDTWASSWVNALWRVLFLQEDDEFAPRVWYHTWLYWYITGYDSWTDEYILDWTWMLQPTISWALYRIYDTLRWVVRVCSDKFQDSYFEWYTENTWLGGQATASLRKIKALWSWEFMKSSTFFSNSYWAFKWKTLFQSKGFPWNPFYYTYTSQVSVTNKEVTGLYVYKNRLIVYWRSFVYAYSQNWTIEKLSDSIWVQDDAIYETGDDLYFISTDKKIISINELASGSLYVKDITEKFNSYTSTWDNNCFIGSDTKNIYFGWCKTENVSFQTKMYMLVFSLDKKFWSVYECPPFKWIFAYNGRAYFTHRWLNSHAYMEAWDSYYSPYETYTTSNTNTAIPSLTSLPYTQRVVTEWLEDGGYKEPEEIELTVENVPSANIPSMFIVKRLAEKIATTDRKTISIPQINSAWWIGSGIIWNEISGGTQYMIDTLFPRKKYQTFNKDQCLAFKIVIENWNDEYDYKNGFYLSDFSVKYNINNTNDWRNTTSTY